MEEGVIAELNIQKGDTIEAGDVIAEVETDKATMEWESFVEGTVLHLVVSSGDSVPVNGIVAVLGEEGEDWQAVLDAESESAESDDAADDAGSDDDSTSGDPSPSPTPAPAPASSGSEASSQTANGRIKASPLARRMAADLGIDLGQVSGSGDEGRIVKRDIESYDGPTGGEAQQPAPTGATSADSTPFRIPAVTGEEGHRDESVSMMRKTIARRLGESKFSAPHFYLTMRIDMTRTIAERRRINEMAPLKISFNDIIIKASAMALRQHPEVNASWMGDTIRYYDHIHIGMAVAVDEGLVVPVIRFADAKPLSVIATEAGDFADKARSRQLTSEEMQGNTFSISNLGMMGIEEFTAVINPPDSCILAVGGIQPEVYLDDDGEVAQRQIMRVTLSCDHRVVDGAVGSRFLQTLKGYLEDPVRMLI